MVELKVVSSDARLVEKKADQKVVLLVVHWADMTVDWKVVE